MSLTSLLRFSPLLVLVAAMAAPACGGSVVGTGGGAGNGTTTTNTGTTTTSSTGTTTNTGIDACTGPGQCILVSTGCCPGCGIAQLGSMTAINADHQEEYYQDLCPEPVACPACESAPNPNLFAYCEAGHCVAADVTTHAVSACVTDSDCHLRNGSACCEECIGSVDQLIAVGAGNDLVGLTCGPNEGCPKCLPVYPQDAVALCAGGHCAVAFMGSGGD